MTTFRTIAENLRTVCEGADLQAGTFLMWLTKAKSPQQAQGKLRAMLGVTQIVTGYGAVQFLFKGSRKVNKLVAKRGAADAYDLTFYRISGVDAKVVVELRAVPGESVAETFTKVTGLDTSL